MHKSGTVSTWCATLVKGKLYTDFDYDVPCLRY